MFTQLAAIMREMTPWWQSDAASPKPTLSLAKRQAVDTIQLAGSSRDPQVVETLKPSVALLHAFVNEAGDPTTAILTPHIHVQLLRVPHRLGEVDAAVGQFTAQASDGEAVFRVRYRCNSAWHMASVDDEEVWSHTCDSYRVPDASLGIFVSPGQEAYLFAENISGLTLTPPQLPALEWRLTFFGAQSAQPRVFARCGLQGPVATLVLDNSEVRWSGQATRHMFAFNDLFGSLTKRKPVRPVRPAPAIPSSTNSQLKPPPAY